jgi:hypothetical protein
VVELATVPVLRPVVSREMTFVVSATAIGALHVAEAVEEQTGVVV